MSGLYILNGKEPVMVNDVIEWAKGFEINNRIVKQDYIGEIFVSTVFLGIDHSYGDEPPLLFETMIFGGVPDQYQERYSTWDEAEEGHKRAIKFVNDGKENQQGEHNQTSD